MNGSDFYPSSNTSFVNNSDFYPSENASFASSLKGHESSHERVNLGEWINEDVQETRLVIGLEYGTTYTSMLPRSFFPTNRLTSKKVWLMLRPRGLNARSKILILW